ncbi:MAG: hypothetical protein JWO53_1126, partial [Chlamydiia bacterium]|nr:hypothetical protein [Chlamydiia bacterium]
DEIKIYYKNDQKIFITTVYVGADSYTCNGDQFNTFEECLPRAEGKPFTPFTQKEQEAIYLFSKIEVEFSSSLIKDEEISNVQKELADFKTILGAKAAGTYALYMKKDGKGRVVPHISFLNEQLKIVDEAVPLEKLQRELQNNPSINVVDILRSLYSTIRVPFSETKSDYDAACIRLKKIFTSSIEALPGFETIITNAAAAKEQFTIAEGVLSEDLLKGSWLVYKESKNLDSFEIIYRNHESNFVEEKILVTPMGLKIGGKLFQSVEEFIRSKGWLLEMSLKGVKDGTATLEEIKAIRQTAIIKDPREAEEKLKAMQEPAYVITELFSGRQKWDGLLYQLMTKGDDGKVHSYVLDPFSNPGNFEVLEVTDKAAFTMKDYENVSHFHSKLKKVGTFTSLKEIQKELYPTAVAVKSKLELQAEKGEGTIQYEKNAQQIEKIKKMLQNKNTYLSFSTKEQVVQQFMDGNAVDGAWIVREPIWGRNSDYVVKKPDFVISVFNKDTNPASVSNYNVKIVGSGSDAFEISDMQNIDKRGMYYKGVAGMLGMCQVNLGLFIEHLKTLPPQQIQPVKEDVSSEASLREIPVSASESSASFTMFGSKPLSLQQSEARVQENLQAVLKERNASLEPQKQAEVEQVAAPTTPKVPISTEVSINKESRIVPLPALGRETNAKRLATLCEWVITNPNRVVSKEEASVILSAIWPITKSYMTQISNLERKSLKDKKLGKATKAQADSFIRWMKELVTIANSK